MRFLSRRMLLPLVFAVITGIGSVSPVLGAPPFAGSGTLPVAPVVPGTPRVVFAGRYISFPAPALAPYRDPSDNILLIAVESLFNFGMSYRLDSRNGTATVVSPDARMTTVRTRRSPTGLIYVPLIEVMQNLGAKCEWEQSTGTVHIRAVLTSVDMLGGQLLIRATLPISARVTPVRATGNAPAKIIVDIPGAERGNLPRTLPLSLPNIASARTGQLDANIARIVLDLREPFALSQPLQQPSTRLTLNPLPTSQVSSQPSVVIQIPPRTDTRPSFPAPAVPAVKLPPPPVSVRAISVRSTGDNRARIYIEASRVPEYRVVESTRDRLTLDLRNVTLGDEVRENLAGADHPLFRAVRVSPYDGTNARLLLDLDRVVVYSIEPQSRGSATGLVIDVTLPRGAGGTLAGKTITVDAGHGGTDPGAYGVGGQREKNIALAISFALRDKLRDAGANVIMTRTDDIKIPLEERPRIANRAGADFFISVHCDALSNRAIRGSTVYFHRQYPSSRALAMTIAGRFGEMGGIPTKGIRSDLVVARRSGFAVLRGAKMPAVLVETGYMTNASDVSRLAQPAMQRRIAGAIAEGLRDYIEGGGRRAGLETGRIMPVSVIGVSSNGSAAVSGESRID